MCKETKCFFPQTSFPCLDPQNPSHPPLVDFWPLDKGLHLSAGEKKLDNTTIVKIPERLLRTMFIERKVDMSIKGGVVLHVERYEATLLDI